MAVYSHSKISTFEQCKYKYKLRYIDKVKVEVPTTIEAFMGSMVHDALEKLYTDIKNNKLDSKEEILKYYADKWDKNYTDDILIVRKEYTANNYKEKGAIFISDYYDRHKPFNQFKIIGLETQEKLELSDGNFYHIRIDRLESDKNGNYYICDYKTSSTMKTEYDKNNDRQLPMYALWVKRAYPDVKALHLIWHMLAFDKDVVLKVDERKLEKVRKEVEKKIKEIEACKEFPTHVSALCNWCVYKSICPAFKHEVELETKRGYDGLKLVDKYDDLNSKKKEIEGEIEDVKKKLIDFSKENKVEVIYGSEKKVSVKPRTKITFKDKEKLVEVMKQKGIYNDFSILNYLKLTSEILKGNLDKDVVSLTEKETTYHLSISKNDTLHTPSPDESNIEKKSQSKNSIKNFKGSKTESKQAVLKSRIKNKHKKGLLKYF